MNIEQLTSALAAHDADPDVVLSALRAKRRRSARNRALLSGGVVAAVGVVVVAVLQPWMTSRPAAPRPPGAANGCAVVSLEETLALARQNGASVILATGSLTGRTVLESEVYYQMKLRTVRTLSGPPVAAGSSGWLGSGRGSAGPIPGADAGALWATDGRLFAIAWPARQTGTTVGPVLRIAPLVHGRVIFSTAGCWDTTGLHARPYHGRLAEIPASGSYARAAQNGFHAVPLATIRRLLAG